jgi:hypothetical protein
METLVETAIFFSKALAEDFARQWVSTRVGALDQRQLFRTAIASTLGIHLTDAVLAFWPDKTLWPGMHPLMNVLKSCGVTNSAAQVASALSAWAENSHEDWDVHFESACLNQEEWITAHLHFDPVYGFSTTV